MDDAKRLFDWRSDALTMANSRDTSAPVWEKHVPWLEKSLQNPARKLLIAEVDGTPVGTVRADEDEDGYTEVSYTVAPEARGKGYGTQMVVQFAKEQLSGKKLKAEILKEGNEASSKIAQALGLSPSEEHTAPDGRVFVVWK